MISTRGSEAVEEEQGESEEEEEKKKDKKKKKMKKKKPSAHGDHHEHDDEPEVVEWEDLDDHEIVEGHKHHHSNTDVLPAEQATGHEDANADEEVAAGRSNGGGLLEYFCT